MNSAPEKPHSHAAPFERGLPRDGRVVAQSELCQEQVILADLDLSLATRAMHGDPGAVWQGMDGTAPVLFGDQIEKEEYEEAQQAPAAPAKL